MVDLLVVLHCFVYLGLVLQTDARPEEIPFVLVSLGQPLGGQYLLQDLCFGVNQLEGGRFWLDNHG